MKEEFLKMFDVDSVGNKLTELIRKTIRYVVIAEDLEKAVKDNGYPFNIIDRKLDIDRYNFGLPYLYKRVECQHVNASEYSEEEYNPHNDHIYLKNITYCKDCLLRLK
jgi:hypothetical protein